MSGLGNPMEPAGEGAQPAENETPSGEDGVSLERTVEEPTPSSVDSGHLAPEPEPPGAPDDAKPSEPTDEPVIAVEPAVETEPVVAVDPVAETEVAASAPVVEPSNDVAVAEPVVADPVVAEPVGAESPVAEPVVASQAEAPVAEPPVVELPVVEAAAETPTETVPASPPKVGDAKPVVGDVATGTDAAPGADAAAPSTPPGAQKTPSATETGKIVEGLVTAVSAESVELTLDDGRPAVIHRRNFGLNDEEPSAVLSIGDRVFGAELAREDPKARVVLSRAWALKRQAWEKVATAAKEGKYVSGRVVSASKKGLVVDVGVRGFVPSSHLELEAIPDMSTYVDQVLELKILEIDPRREKLVLSRRSLLLKAQRKEIQSLLQSLKPGEVRTGKVASLADYGAFVDLGGVSGLVHISELSWHRVAKPADVLAVGQEVEVKILDVKPKKKRISLSIRQTAPDPLTAIEIGAVVTGAVTRLVDFGAFVAIEGFEGLVHLSELAEYRVSTPEEIVTPGDEVGVKILSVDVKRRRIELSIRRAAEYQG